MPFTGIVARVKLRQTRSNQTRDDFVLSEPVAPPRVKRHASVMVARHSMIDASGPQLSAWTTPANKFVSVPILQILFVSAHMYCKIKRSHFSQPNKKHD